MFQTEVCRNRWPDTVIAAGPVNERDSNGKAVPHSKMFVCIVEEVRAQNGNKQLTDWLVLLPIPVPSC